MKILKNVALLAMLFMSIVAVAQQDNVLLDRSFWKGDPDLKTVNQKIAEGNDATALNENAFDAVIYALLEKADDAIVKHLLSFEGNRLIKRPTTAVSTCIGRPMPDKRKWSIFYLIRVLLLRN
jgi:hypothetical protein